MTTDRAQLQTLAQQGVAALQRGDAAAARPCFETITASGQANVQMWLLLAQSCDMLDDRLAARAALGRVLQEDGNNPYALVMMAETLTRDGDDRAAIGWYSQALNAAALYPQLPPDLLQRLQRAEAEVAAIQGRFAAAMNRALASAGVDEAAAGERFGEALTILTGRTRPYLQEPTNFYFPGLPQRAFYDPAEFAWTAALEAQMPAIRAEAEAVLADRAGVAPYVEAPPDRPAKAHSLMNDPRWSAFHLFQAGQPLETNASRCPATMAALANLPLPHIAGRSPMALFSILAPGTHIKPHSGMLNTRLICHLPLIVPPDCRLRVGNHTRTVEAGKMLIFDDSIEHEAWNESDAVRVILLFEIWRPELTAAERAGLTALFESVAKYDQDQG
ncbi:aspartyl/asparaginyl beta-hydroxylase domain-containing protein [Sandarakinorhabdus oryzae]|uniref:aspartyl/asparaginyl beta-hydroxylase domain-containing protein n=1 Tax=Sandarakinorhabdus oryzae TaxID=2675220 RepID=UPI0012E1E209|nr:aspartyl/asparaginyl beta-hydroxylase domain-containing protein [Sandarakinorhabdus oryzae]